MKFRIFTSPGGNFVKIVLSKLAFKKVAFYIQLKKKKFQHILATIAINNFKIIGIKWRRISKVRLKQVQKLGLLLLMMEFPFRE